MSETATLTIEGETLHLAGPVTFETVTPLARKMGKQLTDKISRISCSGITHADSAAVSLLLHALQLTTHRTMPLQIEGIGPALQSLIRLYGVEEIVG